MNMKPTRPLRANESLAAQAWIPGLDLVQLEKVWLTLEAACAEAYQNGINDEKARCGLLDTSISLYEDTTKESTK